MKPSSALDANRAYIRELSSKYRVANPRVFGSVVHGTDRNGSDLDLLVDPLPGTTLFDLGGLLDAIETRLGVPVDLVTPQELPPQIREKVLKEARAI
ncbi:MAG: nucleotidyltransferase family protein [Phyllobacteriaceae bacterium]|jgi:predicted nucleotidyltransferase|nr:nucleotidyltransferase family protein [Phyllobacteriaceae bacterium]